MFKWNLRRRQSGKRIKTYPTEIQNLVRFRLINDVKRKGIARFDLAEDISLWTPLADWCPDAEKWQEKYEASSDGVEGFLTEDIKSGKRDKGFPVTERVFDLWFGSKKGETDNYTTPDRTKLDAIVHYMIDRGIIMSADVEPDDRGFGLANALQNYAGDDGSSPRQEDWHGAFQYRQLRDGECVLYQLKAQPLPNGPMFLTFGASHARCSSITATSIFDGLSRSTITGGHPRSGWAIGMSGNNLFALLREAGDLNAPVRPWVFQLDSSRSERSFCLGWCGDPEIAEELDHNHILEFSNKLQFNTEIDNTLKRSGDQSINIIRRILAMKDFNEVSDGHILSELDMTFLKTAFTYSDDFSKAERLLAAGANINAINPKTGSTALLKAAHWGAEPFAEFLLQQPGIDPLIRHRFRGYLPSEMALFCTGNIAFADRLSDAEIAEEKRRSISPAYEPKFP